MVFSVANELGEPRRIEGLARRIQEHLGGRWMFRPNVKTGRINLPHLAPRVPRRTLQVLLGECVSVSVSRLADI